MVSPVLVLQARALVVQVDPTVPLTNVTALAEWNTDGDLDGWTVSGTTTATVADGLLSATDDGTFTVVRQFQRLNIANGPDLDVGYNDFLDLRIQLPADYAGDVQFLCGTTKTAGINSARSVTLSNSVLQTDGVFHTYRIEMGLEPLWRSVLPDARIVALTGNAAAGQSFAIDFVRVGDVTGEVYAPRYSANCPAPGSTAPSAGGAGIVSSMESKHFRVLRNPTVTTEAGWTSATPAGTLRNLDECWRTHVKMLGHREPSESWTPALPNGDEYKINLTL